MPKHPHRKTHPPWRWIKRGLLDLRILNSLSSYLSAPVTKYSDKTSHGKILESVFNLKFGASLQTQTAGGILKIYSDVMAPHVASGRTKAENIFYSAFVYRSADGKRIWKKFGSEIEKGDDIHKEVLTSTIHNEMLSAGYFSIGDETLTSTNATIFQHVFAQLTNFMLYSEYKGIGS